MELSRADINILKNFFSEDDLERIVISGHVRKGVLRIRFDLINEKKIIKSLRAFIGNGRLLLFESD